MNSNVNPCSNTIRFSSLNLKNHSFQIAKKKKTHDDTFNSWCAMPCLQCRNPNPISIWQLLSFWVKSLISVACRAKIYHRSFLCSLTAGRMPWKSKVCHLQERSHSSLLSRRKPYCFSHTQLALSLSEEGLFHSLLLLPHEQISTHTSMHDNETGGGAVPSNSAYLPVSSPRFPKHNPRPDPHD